MKSINDTQGITLEVRDQRNFDKLKKKSEKAKPQMNYARLE